MEDDLKKIVALIFISICSLLGFAACSQPPSFYAEFDQDEYVLNIGEAFDAQEHLDLTGIDFEQVEIAFSNPDIFDDAQDELVASQSGETLLFANHDGQTLAQCRVYVNYVFDSPENLQISKDGVLSWSEPVIRQGANLIRPQQYIVEIGQNRLYRVNDNSFSFADRNLEYNSYQVRIQAVGIESSHILSSEFSQTQTIVYDYVSMIAGLNIQVSNTFLNQETTLSWNGSEGVVYDVFFNGFKVTQTPLSAPSFTYDFAHFGNGAEIEVEIVAYDAAFEDPKLSVSHSYTLNKLRAVDAGFVYAQGDGYLVINDSQEASGYTVHWSSVGDGESGQKIINSGQRELLNELENGVYNISVQAIGGSDGDLLYLNSNNGQSFQFAKLASPQVQVEVERQQINLTIAQDPEGYVDSYKVVVGRYQQIVDADVSLEISIDASYLNEGENTLEVYALPKADEISSTGVAYYTHQNAVTNRVLSSKPFSQTVYLLSEIGQIQHSFGQSDSILTFDNVPYADNFRLFVGQQEIYDFDFEIGARQTTIRFSALNGVTPDENNNYQISVEAFRNDGYAVESSGLKTLQILDVPTRQDSENGQFRWSAVEGDVVYSYTITKTDELGQNGQVVAQESTTDQCLLELLPFGYYSIEVVACSNDENYYLDSNFRDGEKVLTEQFVVTEQIAAPALTFTQQDGQFRINISAVDYASHYAIYLGEDEIDAFTVSQEQEVYTRVINQTFSQEQVYQISVVASAGELYDEILHPASEASIVNITRIAAPSYSVQELYSQNGRFGIEGEYGQKIEERLILSSGADDQFVKNFDIKANGESANINLENYINLMGRGESFSLSLSAIAIEDDVENGNYYLDSAVNEVVVSRLSRPTDFDYQDGEISFVDSNMQQTQNYFVEIELFIESGNRTISFFTNSSDQNFDIEQQLEFFNQNTAFSYEFAQASKIGIKVFAYTAPQISQGQILLESLEAVSSVEEHQLIVEKMVSPVLSFSPDGTQGTLSWTRTGQDTVYDVYNGEEVVLSDFTGNQTSLSSVLKGLDLTQTTATFKVVAKNSEYLNSSASNQINVAQLSDVAQIRVSQNQTLWQATLSIDDPADARRISQILVCGQPISYQTGLTSATIDLSNYSDELLTISLVASNNETEQTYYLDSSQTQFSLTDISSDQLNATITDGKLSWNNPFEQWQIDEGLVSFTIVVATQDNQYTISNVAETSISLADIESLIQSELDSQEEITLSIYSQLAPFSILSGESASYGQASQSGITVDKVDPIANAIVQIQLGSSDDLISQQRDSVVSLSFDNIWQGQVDFDVYINQQLAFAGVSLSNPYSSCRVEQAEGGYRIMIASSMFAQAGEHAISIKVNQENKISSVSADFAISRNSDIVSAALSADGVLSVNYGQISEDTLVVRLSIGQQTYFEQFSSSVNEIDLSDFLHGKNGGVSIDLIVISSSNSMLCSPINYNISATKLAAIQNIEISDDGQILLSLQSNSFTGNESNIEFVVQTESGQLFTFNPIQTENSFVFSYSLQDFVKLLSISQENSYSLELAVRVQGSLNSDFTSFTLNYKIEQTDAVQKKRSSQVSDYFVFDTTIQDGLSTTGFVINIKDSQGQNLETQTITVQSANGISGFWDGNTNQFVLTNPGYDGAENDNVYACYALSINSILENYDYGQFEIEICRIASDGESYYIFSSKNFSLMKLNNVIEDRLNPLAVNIARNILSWNWIKADEALPENFAPAAYMISFWPAGAQTQVQTLIVSENSLDLTSINLTEGYNLLTIQAFSQDENIVASSVLDTPLEPFKYYQTTPVTLEEGKIVYNLNRDGVIDTSIDFVSVFDSASGVNLADNLDRIGDNGFRDIYHFQIGTVASQTIKLRFTSTDPQGLSSTGQTYYATVNAMNLLPNFSVGSEDFLTQMKNYIDQHSESLEVNFQQLVSFYQTIESMAQGLGDGAIIFDDFGRAIPAGYYNISICQTATNPLDDYIDSNYSSAKLVYLSPAPSMAMQTELDEQSGEETYSASFNVVSIVSDEGLMQRAYDYVMLLRRNSSSGEENAYRFMISYDGAWTISNGGESMQNIISGDENGFVINYTALGELANGDEYLIDKSYSYNVYIYAVGNSRSCFGKSSVMSLTFLSLDSSNISVVDGYFVITTSQNEVGSDILVKYRRQYGSGMEAQEEIVRVSQDLQGRVVLNDILTYSGLYDYVAFNVMGQIDNATSSMKLPSASYGILNLYKLSSPSLTTSQNQLQISASMSDQNYGSFIYRLTNGELEINSTSQYFDANSGNLNTLVLDHSQYDVDGTNQVCFIAPSISAIGIIENESSQEGLPYFEYLIDLDRIVLSSQSSQISLQKLDEISNFRIENGDLVWDEAQLSGFDENVMMIYRLQVDYYDSTGYKGTNDFYTCLNRFDTTLLENIYSQGSGAFFNLSVYAYAGFADGLTELVEGGQVDIASQIITQNGSHALHSAPATMSSVVKQIRPGFAVEQQTYQGKIAITRSRTNLSFAINLVDQSGTHQLIEGEDFAVESDVIILADNTQLDVYFISIINENFASSSTFTLQIYAYSVGTIKSEPLQSKALYKFHAVDLSDIQVNLIDETNVLDLTEYFEKYLYSYSNAVYQIEFDLADGRTFVLDSSNMAYGDNAGENINLNGQTVEVVVKPKTEQSNYLASNNVSITFSSFNEEEPLNFAFNEQMFRFEWSYGNSKQYQFYIELNYQNGENETAFVQSYQVVGSEETVWQYYYQPNKMGTISQVNLYARELEQDITEPLQVQLFGKVEVQLEDAVEFNLFESGDGTESSPYAIATAEQFSNIALRDAQNENVYFELASSFELTLSEYDHVLNSFYGNLNGNGNTITVNFEKQNYENAQNKGSVALGSGSTTVNFMHAQSIIGTIAQTAVVENLNLTLNQQISGEGYQPTVLSGLALNNYGTVANVNVSLSSSQYSNSLSSLALAGVVGFNYGTIEACQNNASFAHTYPSSAMILIYGGIALQNATKGVIKGCLNNGDISVVVRAAGSGVYGGGVVYDNNGGQVYACGNNGEIAFEGSAQFAAAFGGVIGRNMGRAGYLFNNSTVSSTNGGISGVIYYYRSGELGDVFEFSGADVISAIYGSTVNQQGQVYAYQNSSAGLTITLLPDGLTDGQRFVYNNEYALQVSQENQRFSISLSKI